jgi:hypothetical protein
LPAPDLKRSKGYLIREPCQFVRLSHESREGRGVINEEQIGIIGGSKKDSAKRDRKQTVK